MRKTWEYEINKLPRYTHYYSLKQTKKQKKHVSLSLYYSLSALSNKM